MIDYKALAERVAQRAIYADNNADPNNKAWAADLRAVVSLLNGMADAQPVAHYAMLDSHRRLVERAIGDASRPSGMSTHDGKARIDASILRRMLAIIDSLPAVPQAADRCRSSETSDPKATGPASPERPASNREDAAAMVAAGSGEQAEPIDPHMIVADDRFPDEQAEPKREPLSDEQVTKGEYVLATKFGDGDPGDHWGVGFYDRFANGRHYVVDSAGKQIRGNGFRRVGRITVDVGRWFLSAGRSLEASPPGTVNLWTMLTERAHRIGGTDPALDDLQAKERA